MLLRLFVLADVNVKPAERRARHGLAVVILQGLHLRGGQAEITDCVVVIAQRSVAPAAPVNRNRLLMAFAQTSPNRNGLGELFYGLAQRVSRLDGAQLFAFADGAFACDSPAVFILRLSQLGRGYKVF